MTALERPDVRLYRSWAAAVEEYGDGVMHGSGDWQFERLELTEAGYARFVDFLRAQGDPGTPMPEGRVHSSYFWIVDGEESVGAEFVGYLALRHSLTPWLLEEGGHIGYSVRPGRRREGHATRALALALPEARALGLDRVLVTCDDDNEPSRRTIERNGGVYEDARGRKLRYWIDLG